MYQYSYKLSFLIIKLLSSFAHARARCPVSLSLSSTSARLALLAPHLPLTISCSTICASAVRRLRTLGVSPLADFSPFSAPMSLRFLRAASRGATALTSATAAFAISAPAVSASFSQQQRFSTLLAAKPVAVVPAGRLFSSAAAAAKPAAAKPAAAAKAAPVAAAVAAAAAKPAAAAAATTNSKGFQRVGTSQVRVVSSCLRSNNGN